MFFYAKQLLTDASPENLSLEDFNAQINSFAEHHQLAPDIFYELLFTAATDYFINEYKVTNADWTTEQAKDYLFGPNKLSSSRPVVATILEIYEHIDKNPRYFLRFYGVNDDESSVIRLNKLWAEIILAYFEHKLGQKFETNSYFMSDEQCSLMTVEVPLKSVLCLLEDDMLLAKILNDESKSKAYFTVVDLNFDSMLHSINTCLQTHEIDTRGDAFEYALCTMFGVSLPSLAKFSPKNTEHYYDYKLYFSLQLNLSSEDAEILISSVNNIENGAAMFVGLENGVYTIDMQYNFAQNIIIPNLWELMDNPEFVAICKKQHAECIENSCDEESPYQQEVIKKGPVAFLFDTLKYQRCRESFNMYEILREVEKIIEPYHIHYDCCDVFEFAVCKILDVTPLPSEAKLETQDFNNYFTLHLKLPQEAVDKLIKSANEIESDSAILVYLENETYKICMKYSFAHSQIIPKLADLMKDQDFVALCQEQYAIKSQNDPKAKFYDHYHQATVKNRLGL